MQTNNKKTLSMKKIANNKTIKIEHIEKGGKRERREKGESREQREDENKKKPLFIFIRTQCNAKNSLVLLPPPPLRVNIRESKHPPPT